MTHGIDRRKFLKISGLGTAATVLVGCGPATRVVRRQPYADMPEYNQTGVDTFFASTCRECPAGCGILVRTREGRALRVDGNPAHPVNRGKLCPRGMTSVQGLYNPDRITAPRKNVQRGGETYDALDWTAALEVVRQALAGPADGIAFLLGYAPDHLFDLVSELADRLGAPPPVRYSALAAFEARATLVQAARSLFGEETLPYFDLANAEVTFAFGASFLETWLSPVSYARAYGQMRQGRPRTRGYLVSFEARQSLTSANADEWVPVVPGSEALVALALGRLVAQRRGEALPALYASADVSAAAAASGVSEERLNALADLFTSTPAALAIPGGAALTSTNGLAAAQAVLGLNILAGNSGKPGGVFLNPAPGVETGLQGVQELVGRMNAGQVQTLFVHGVNPVFDLPAGMGFSAALGKVGTVISFASFPDETALYSDYVLPDHSALESWGYQRVLPGGDRQILSGAQPVVVPLYDTRATADVLLSAGVLPYKDEVDFLQNRLLPYIGAGGTFTAPEILTFWSQFLQYGGWWQTQPSLQTRKGSLAHRVTELTIPAAPAADEFHLVVYPTQLGDGSGANRPWLQETPDAATTVMWNNWVEIHPDTAHRLGVSDDDVVRIISPYGEIEASVYLFPAVRPDTVALPFGQGHTALGRYAAGRGSNPARLLGGTLNEAGDPAFADVRVRISPTGRKRALARYESRRGVYGDHE